ncbi:amidohydrolase family protein [Nocardioides daejeonensis]|uniref:amidohydrolase family protein n=1 Tax=Nocardioides daejeonensis TaxID=1046556 RepID=UPI000D74C46A|nr:amidohydrolase family protein [Nocardioides daejeonensis]
MRTIDAHMHLINVTEHDWYPGLKVWGEALGVPGLYADFLLDDYRAGDGRDVETFVHVSATTKPRAYLDETAWLDRLADEHALDLLIVATVDPTLDRAELLADLEAQAASPRLRGLRVLDGLEPGSPAADTVLRWLQERGLVFDLVTHPEQMAAWLHELNRHPELRVVLEHTGWPTGTDPEARTTWEQAMRAFATSTPYLCKLSGLGMTTMDLAEPALRPWLEFAIDQLGWERVAFGSNLPIETMAGTHRQLLAALESVVAGADAEAQAGFWAENAARAYAR